MENEKKGKKVLEIILIILFSLSFVLIPLLNQYRQKIISSNRTQLVKKANDRNGTIDIIEYDYGVVKTITGSNLGFDDYTLYLNQSIIDNNLSLTGTTDIFGFGFNNYFRFSPVLYGNNIVALEYYLEFDTGLTKSYKISYYFKPEILIDGTDQYMQFQPVSRTSFINLNVLPEYNILNFSYYNISDFNTFYDYINANEVLSNLITIDSNYRYSANYFDYVVNKSLVNFINIDKDFVTPLLDATSTSSYQDGYDSGYDVGFNQASSDLSVFTMLKYAANSIQDLLNIEVLPNISLWLLISIPLSVSIMLILFKLLRGDN